MFCNLLSWLDFMTLSAWALSIATGVEAPWQPQSAMKNSGVSRFNMLSQSYDKIMMLAILTVLVMVVLLRQ